MFFLSIEIQIRLFLFICNNSFCDHVFRSVCQSFNWSVCLSFKVSINAQIESPSNNPEKDNSWGQDENPELKTLNVEDENTAGKRKVKLKEKTVKEMFDTQKKKADIENTERLEKESRLDKQRRQELRRKGKRDHHCRLR